MTGSKPRQGDTGHTSTSVPTTGVTAQGDTPGQPVQPPQVASDALLPEVDDPADSVDSNVSARLQFEKNYITSSTIDGSAITGTVVTSASIGQQNVRIVIDLPARLDYVPDSMALAQYDAIARQLTLNALALPAGKSVLTVGRFVVSAPATAGRQASPDARAAQPAKPNRLRVEVTTYDASTAVGGGTVGATLGKRLSTRRTLIHVSDPQQSARVDRATGGQVDASDRLKLAFAPNALAASTAISTLVYAPAAATLTNTTEPYCASTLAPR